jgi:hypothetical protein
MLSFADEAGRGTGFETFSLQLHRAVTQSRLPVHAPRPLRLVDVKHWVRRRWPLPPAATWSMATWVDEYIADDGWELKPHGVELAAVRGLRDPSLAGALAHPLPDLLRTEYVDGYAVTILALYAGGVATAGREDASFSSEAELLAWLRAPAGCHDLWSLAHLERLEADEASRLWIEDLHREAG